MLLAPLALLVVVGIVLALSIALRADGRPGWMTVPVLLAAAVIPFLVLPFGLLFGLRGGDGESEGDVTTTTAVASATTSTTTQTDFTKSSVARPSRNRAVDVFIDAPLSGELPEPADAVSSTREGEVLLLEVRNLLALESGTAFQCEGGECGPAVPVQVGKDGRALFLFEVGPCASGRCTLVVDAETRLHVPLAVGVPAAEPASVVITPASGLQPGDTVTAQVRGLEPGERAVLTQCGVVVAGTPTCGGDADEVVFVADASGSASVDYRVRSVEVGRGTTAPCDRNNLCGVAVLDAAGSVRSYAASLTFGTGGSADYDGERLLAGVVVAAVCAAIATWLIRRTDWTPVGLPSTTDDAPDPPADPFAGVELDLT